MLPLSVIGVGVCDDFEAWWGASRHFRHHSEVECYYKLEVDDGVAAAAAAAAEVLQRDSLIQAAKIRDSFVCFAPVGHYYCAHLNLAVKYF